MLEKSKGAINNGHTETLTYKTPDEENREREKNHTSTKNAIKMRNTDFTNVACLMLAEFQVPL